MNIHSAQENVHKNTIKSDKTIPSLKKKIQDSIFRGILLQHSVRLGYPVQVHGVENIPNENAIFVTTHLGDEDVMSISDDLYRRGRDINIASQQTNFDDIITAIPQRITGRFQSISNTREGPIRQGEKGKYYLDSSDMMNFIETIKTGKDLVIAGHRPTHDGAFPKKAGVGGIIVARITDKPIIPVSLVRHENGFDMYYHEPLSLKNINDEERDNLKNWILKKESLSINMIKILRDDAKVLLDVYSQAQNNTK